MPISEVTAGHVLDVLAPLWHKKPKTGGEVRSNLSTVLDWAITMGHRTANPASAAVARNLGRQARPVHHRSLEPNALGKAMALVRDADAWWAEKACLLFINFTCVRSGEARGATWDEVDLDTSTWTVPATRMKASVKHRVPLSTQALALLAHARDQSGRSQGTIFPPQRGDKYMDGARIATLLRHLEIPAVPHGVRTSFRNWAGGRADIAQPAAEMVLAHTPSEAIVKVYLTADFFEHRQPIMQAWADFICETMGSVTPTPATL